MSLRLRGLSGASESVSRSISLGKPSSPFTRASNSCVFTSRYSAKHTSNYQSQFKVTANLLSTRPNMPNIKLQSSDGEIFEVDIEVARMSITLRTMLDDLGIGQDDDVPIPIQNVNSAILGKVIQWATHHKDDPPTQEDDDTREKRNDDISSWDAAFLEVDKSTLFKMILAANYLDIKGLLDVTCKTVANMIRGKTPEEIRQAFNSTPQVEE